MEPPSSETAKSESFKRLQEEHAKALQTTQAAIKKWEQFKYDYEVLQARLHTLPDRLTHDVMVPFGRFGFMQGQLYHTNEVMVLLGDNWFAQRTAKQAIAIAERRRKYVCEMLDKEKEQLKDWEAREDFVQELSAAAEGHKDGFEIREEYDPVEEEKRKKAKREERERKRGAVKVPPPRPAFPKTAASTGSVKTARTNEIREGEKEGESEEEIWARLEKQEAEEEGEEKEEGEEEEEGEEGGEEEKEEGEGEELVRGHEAGEGSGGSSRPAATITFKHSETVPCLEDTTAPVMDGGRMVYSSPADIFRQQQEHATTERETSAEERGGEGAMKGVHWDPNLVSYSQQAEQAETTSTLTSMSQAFSGLVVERKEPASPPQQSTPRRVSKFKSSRT